LGKIHEFELFGEGSTNKDQFKGAGGDRESSSRGEGDGLIRLVEDVEDMGVHEEVVVRNEQTIGSTSLTRNRGDIGTNDHHDLDKIWIIEDLGGDLSVMNDFDWLRLDHLAVSFDQANTTRDRFESNRLRLLTVLRVMRAIKKRTTEAIYTIDSDARNDEASNTRKNGADGGDLEPGLEVSGGNWVCEEDILLAKGTERLNSEGGGRDGARGGDVDCAFDEGLASSDKALRMINAKGFNLAGLRMFLRGGKCKGSGGESGPKFRPLSLQERATRVDANNIHDAPQMGRVHISLTKQKFGGGKEAVTITLAVDRNDSNGEDILEINAILESPGDGEDLWNMLAGGEGELRFELRHLKRIDHLIGNGVHVWMFSVLKVAGNHQSEELRQTDRLCGFLIELESVGHNFLN
jgi:hypothetical protein